MLGYDKFQDSFWYVKHQLLSGLLPGVLLYIFFSRIDFRVWKKFAPALLFFTIVLLVLVFIPGIGADYGKAKSWISVGGFSLQPSEIVKLTFLLYLAAWFEKRKERLHTLAYGLVPFLLYLGLVIGLVMLEPDTGTMTIILMMSLLVYFLAGAKWSHLLGILVVCAAGFAALIKVAPYRMARLMTFINPEIDPQGKGYHIRQALLAVGSGGWWGVGFGNSKQKFQYLPEVAGDSIFAIMAEELGFVIMVLFIVALAWFIIRMLKVSRNSSDFFGQLVAAGIAGWIGIQAVFNIGAMAGMLPLTGVPLPLVSYGGTAMMTAMAGVGIVVNVSRYTKE